MPTSTRIAYAATMGAAILAGVLLLRRSQTKLQLTWKEKAGLAIGAFCGGMIGSKVPFVLSDWDGMLSGWAWISDGKTILCGIVGAYFGVELAKWTLDIRTKTGDSFAVPAAVAIGIGRLACFIGGCCYGTATNLPWGVEFPHVVGPRHPTQLYEMAFHLTMAIVLWQLGRRGMFRGQLFKLYMLTYLAYRFLTEFIRPESKVWLGLTGYQLACIVLGLLFAWLWYRDVKQSTPATKPVAQ